MAAFLYEKIIDLDDLDVDVEPSIEGIDVLFDFLSETTFDNPECLDRLLQGKLNGNITRFNIFDQILDIVFAKDIDLFDIFYNLTGYDNGEHLRAPCKQILINRFILKRYICCLAYYKDIKSSNLFEQVKALQKLLYPLDFISRIYNWMHDTASDIYNMNYPDTLYEDNNDILLILKEIEKLDDSDSKKAMEWARSGQLELPEK